MSLFGNKTDKHQDVQMSQSNIIGKGTTIIGDIETFGNIRIDGRLIGNIRSKSKVALGMGSYVEGNIFAQNAEIEGEIRGKLEITDQLMLHPTAVIQGDIITGKLVVHAGAKFDGTCKMGASAANAQQNGSSDQSGKTKELKVETSTKTKATA